jgi:Cdc6-like AAA superfamily ATPase
MANWIERLFSPKPAKRSAAALDQEPAMVRLDLRKPAPVESRSFPSFLSSASDQVLGKSADAIAIARSKLRKAYTPSHPVTNRALFAGRRELLTSLIRAIEDQRMHAVIYGERGIGKTSTLRMLASAAQEARYFVVNISCGADSTFEEVFRSIAAEIPLLYHEEYGPTAAEAERHSTFASLVPKGPISVGGAAEIFSKIVGTRILVVLDEFDRVSSEEFRHRIAELLKNLSDRAARVQLIIAGVAVNLVELIERVPSSQRNVFALRIPRMTEVEVRELVENGEGVAGLKFLPPAVDMVCTMSCGLPYLANLICHHAGVVALSEKKSEVSPSDVSIAVDRALEEIKGHLSRKAVRQIEGRLDESGRSFFGSLAEVAQGRSGSFRQDDVSALARNDTEAGKLRGAVDVLAADGVLIERYDDDLGVAYRFVEDNVPSYMWLLQARNGRVGFSSATKA